MWLGSDRLMGQTWACGQTQYPLANGFPRNGNGQRSAPGSALVAWLKEGLMEGGARRIRKVKVWMSGRAADRRHHVRERI